MSNQQIKRGAIISYAAIFINIAAGLLYTPWMIGQIGRGDYGLYVLMTSVLTYFIIDYGLSQSVTRLLAKYKTEGDTTKIDNLLGVTAKLYLIFDILVVIALIIFFFFIDKVFVELTAIEIIKFKQIYAIAGFFSILSFPMLYISGIYYAFELFLQIKVFDLISKLGTVFLTVIVLLFGYGLYELVFVYALTPFLINVGKIIYLKHKGYLNINWTFWDNKVLKGILSTSIWLLIILIGELFLKNISPTILGIFSGTEEIAIFSIASALDSYILVFASALNGLFLPKISLYLNKNSKEKLTGRLMIKVGRFQVMLIGFLTLGLFLLGKDFIYLWVGSNFAKSYYVLLCLVFPTFLFSILQLGTTYILAINKLRYQAYIYVLAAFFNVILAVIFTPKYGAIGTGISIFICKSIFYILGFSYVFHKVLKINMIIFYKSTFRNLFIPLVFTILIYITFDYYTMLEVNNLSFVVNCVVFSIVFAFLMFKFYLNTDEIAMMRSYFRKIGYKK